jgi:hypothetical protein
MKSIYGRGPSSKGLEPVSGNNIGNLSPQWPSDNEIIAQGDDHLRATRRATSGSFTTIGTSQIVLTGPQLTEVINRDTRLYIVRYYNGLSTNIPVGWTICDGANGTPPLIDNYVRGSAILSGDTGGNPENLYSQESAGHEIDETELPPHNHTFSYRPGGTIDSGQGDDNEALDETLYTKYTGNTLDWEGRPWPTTSSEHKHTLDIGNIEPVYYTLIPIMFTGV